MAARILVFYGSYRSDRLGIRLANFIVSGLRARDVDVEMIDAKVVGLPMLDRMYQEFAPGSAPPPLESLAAKLEESDAFICVTGEYSWGMQPAVKSVAVRLVGEWFWRPAAIGSD